MREKYLKVLDHIIIGDGIIKRMQNIWTHAGIKEISPNMITLAQQVMMM